MFKFLFVIFFFFLLLIFLMGFSILRALKNIFFGSSKQSSKRNYTYTQTRNSSSSSQDINYTEESNADRPHRPHRKIFTKDEGEYVDYEEVK